MSLNAYEKYKIIVEKFLKNEKLSPRMIAEENEYISEDTAEKIFTQLKKCNL